MAVCSVEYRLGTRYLKFLKYGCIPCPQKSVKNYADPLIHHPRIDLKSGHRRELLVKTERQTDPTGAFVPQVKHGNMAQCIFDFDWWATVERMKTDVEVSSMGHAVVGRRNDYWSV